MAEFTGTSGNDNFTNLGGGGSLVLVVSGTAAEGGVLPRFNVLVNGAVQSEIAVTAPAGATQTFSVAMPSSITSLGIQYLNDNQSEASYIAGEDRNLFIKSIALNNVPLDPSSATYIALFGDGSSVEKPKEEWASAPGQADMLWGGTLTFSGAAVASAAASGGAGTNDTFNGGAGVDTVVFSGAHAEYGVLRTSSGWSVTRGSEADALVDVERLQFSDHNVALDVDGNAGWAVKIISALFGGQWAASPSIVGVGISLLDAGMSPQAVIQAVVNKPDFSNLSGSNETFVRTVYQNLTGSTASEQFVTDVANLIVSGQHTKESIGLIAAGLVGVPDTGIVYA
ncbi:MAG TPA: carbohydrate-binding domain-containing protein [Ramlibacter sp.]